MLDFPPGTVVTSSDGSLITVIPSQTPTDQHDSADIIHQGPNLVIIGVMIAVFVVLFTLMCLFSRRRDTGEVMIRSCINRCKRSRKDRSVAQSSELNTNEPALDRPIAGDLRSRPWYKSFGGRSKSPAPLAKTKTQVGAGGSEDLSNAERGEVGSDELMPPPPPSYELAVSGAREQSNGEMASLYEIRPPANR
ncbi:MAG: hypothetical protein M1836_001570 [Candelina mexicana]|nr:MAG: hypothetical protein M1836_001570 [Candelina mexicana]